MKISVIMQVYLGEYPGARSNPKYKFIRAVNSFLLQKHPDKELIIASDGCEDTKRLYEGCFSSFSNIKFTYVARGNVPRMYEESNGKRYYRGVPRQVGRALADGEVTTYMDSDDILLPSAITHINHAWERAEPGLVWSYNRMAVQPRVGGQLGRRFQPASGGEVDLKLYGFPIDEKAHPCYYAPEGKMVAAPWLISHRSTAKSKWKDTCRVFDSEGKIVSGNSEDGEFVNGLLKESAGFNYNFPGYVVCHYVDGWDI